MLHIAPEDNIITPESGFVELGIDSLVAVDIRSWFQSELQLDMPVLKILSGASIENTVEDAFNRLGQELTPNFKREEVVVEEVKSMGEEKGSESDMLKDDLATSVSTEGPGNSDTSSSSEGEGGS